MHFDPKAESWFTVSVQPHYEMGALDFVLEQRRSKEEVIVEAVYKKWLGQAVEVRRTLPCHSHSPHTVPRATHVVCPGGCRSLT